MKTFPGKVSVSIVNEEGLAKIQPRSRSVHHRRRIQHHGFRPFFEGVHHQAAAPDRSRDKIRRGKLWKIGSNMKWVPSVEGPGIPVFRILVGSFDFSKISF